MILTCPLCKASWECECPEEYCTEANKIPCKNCINNKPKYNIIAYLIKIGADLKILHER